MKIMVGLDETTVSQKILDVAKMHAKAFGADVELVISMETGDEEDQERIKRAEEDLEKKKKVLESQKIRCNTHLLIRGLTPGEDLVQFAKEKDVEEVIVGVRRKSKVGKLVFGSTAQYVILHAHCPVVSVK
ncbi:MAG: universal stress protein [Thermodesulfobacteriota bacterium]